MTTEIKVHGGPTEAEMVQAVYRSDSSYDGLFFFGVVTTGIFCFPSCPARKPRRANLLFFRSREEAVSQGFRPCQRCRTDLEHGRRSYEADLVDRVKEIVDRDLDSVSIGRLAAAVALDPHHLMRLFRRVTGDTLNGYVRRRRALRAAELLKVSHSSVFDVAFAVGFASASAFYDAFHRIIGVSPGQYRRSAQLEGHRRGTR